MITGQHLKQFKIRHTNSEAYCSFAEFLEVYSSNHSRYLRTILRRTKRVTARQLGSEISYGLDLNEPNYNYVQYRNRQLNNGDDSKG